MGYLALKNSQNVTQYEKGNYIDSSIRADDHESPCIRDFITVNLEIENKRLPADIINCGINNDTKDAKTFFLTGDPFSSDSAFIIDRTESSDFKLQSHIGSIRVLKQSA